MSRDPLLKAAAPGVEERVGPEHAADQSVALGYWPVGKPIPATVRDRDLMAIVGLGHARYFTRKKRGDFAFLELRPQLPDSPTLYSGELVALWLAGDLKLRKASTNQPVAMRKAG